MHHKLNEEIHKVYDLGTPPYKFIGKPRDNVYLGIEFETGVPDEKVDDFIRGVQGMGYIGCDGTVAHPNPVEFRAHPMSFEQARKHWNKFFTHHGDSVVESRGAGIHIHLSHAMLPDEVWARMFFFINRSSNRDYVYAMARRGDGRYHQYINCGDRFSEATGVCCIYYPKAPLYKQTHHGHSFAWVGNGSLPTRDSDTERSYPATHELRIFKSTSDHRTFMSYIEFTRALVDYCKRTHREALLTPQGFYMYLMRKKKRYPNILQRTKEFLSKV